MPITLSITLTDEQLAAIDHVVIEGAEAWVNHAFDHFVAKIITDKAQKYLPDMLAAKARHGAAYKTAKVRHEEEMAAEAARFAKERADREAERAKVRQDKIDRLVAKGMPLEQAEILVDE